MLAIGRTPLPDTHGKLQQLIHRDLSDFSPLEAQLAGTDACFFCLGFSSAGRSEADYRHVTFDFTLAAARTLAKAQPRPDLHLRIGDGDRQQRARTGPCGRA